MSYNNYYSSKTEQGHKAARSPWEIFGLRKIGKFYSRTYRRICGKKMIRQELANLDGEMFKEDGNGRI
jgi:hypothetical protein